MSLNPLFKFAGDLFSLNNFDMFIIKYESSAGKLFDNSVFKDVKITRGMYTEIDSKIDDSGTNFYNDVTIPTSSKEIPILLAEYIPIRHTEITIPQASWNTISIDFLNKKVTKAVPQVKLNKKLAFNLLPDANLQILKHYQDVSKTNYLNIDMADVQSVKDAILLEDFYERSRIKYAIVVNHSCLNYQALLANGKTTDELSAISDMMGTVFSGSVPYYVFEDVNFLGSSTPIKFSQNNQSSDAFAIDFIYKNVHFYKGEI